MTRPQSKGVRGALSESAEERRQTVIDFARTSLRWTGYAVPAVVLPLILGYSIKDSQGNPVLSNYDQMVVGALLFIVITLAAITQQFSTLARTVDYRSRTSRIEKALDGALSNIRLSYEVLLQRGEYQENLYAQIFDDAISDLEESIHKAASDHTVPVDRYTYRASQLTTDIIARRNRDVLRFVHYFGDDFLTTVQGQDFYRRISAMCCNGNVQLRRLCVYIEPDQLQDPAAKRLFEYHSRNRNHEYRVLSLDVWTSILNDAEMREHGDMGVWGDILCYRSPKHNAGNTEGTYSTDRQTITRMANAFDRAWEYADIPVKSSAGPTTVYELAAGQEPPESLREREAAVVAAKRPR